MNSTLSSPRSMFVTRMRDGSPGRAEGCPFNSQGEKDILRFEWRGLFLEDTVDSKALKDSTFRKVIKLMKMIRRLANDPIR